MGVLALLLTACGLAEADGSGEQSGGAGGPSSPSGPPLCEEGELRLSAELCEGEARRVERCEGEEWLQADECRAPDDCEEGTAIETEELCEKSDPDQTTFTKTQFFNRRLLICKGEILQPACACGTADAIQLGSPADVDSQEKAEAVSWVPYLGELEVDRGWLAGAGLDHLLCADVLSSKGGSSPSFANLLGVGLLVLSGKNIPRFPALRSVNYLELALDRSDVRGLEALEEVRTQLAVSSPELVSLDGLSSLERVGALLLSGEKLSSVEALSGITEIEGLLQTKYIPVASLGGLRNIRRIREHMAIHTRFGSQEDLRVFEQLEEIWGDVNLLAEWAFRCETFHFFRKKTIGGELRVNGLPYDPEECPEP